MKSSIFFRNFTQIDCGYIDEKGLVHGESFNVSAKLTGNVSEDESVVVDFSTGKSLMKKYIDDKDSGFDHKLLIFINSNAVFKEISNEFVNISSPNLFLSGAFNAFKLCHCNLNNLNEYIQTYLEKQLLKDGFNVKVDIELSTKGFDNEGSYFSYFHSLKDSSSFGCQAFHGHRSFIEVVGDKNLQNVIVKYMDDKILIYKENITSQQYDSSIVKMSYECSRGKFSAIFTEPHKWLIYDTETTIEFLIEHIRNKFKDNLKGKILRISEGLAKGAEIEC